MKRTLILLLFTAALLSGGCEKIDGDCPDCIKDKIRDFAKAPVCPGQSSVALYTFQGQDVYVFSDGSCGADLGASVYSSDCLYMGLLGGFAGNMKINGVIFYQNAEFRKVVWKD